MTRAPSEPVLAAPTGHAASPRDARAILRGVGLAVPARRWAQPDLADLLVGGWGLERAAASRFRRLSEATTVAWRHTVADLRQVLGMTTAERMAAYEQLAPDLAMSAARRALRATGVAPEAVTDLIVVSCTGFSAPGLDIALARGLGLAPSVRRTIVGFMGCYGAIIGLRAGIGACVADPEGVALVVCLELCSLHVRDDADIQNQVASALFADGAAAAVVSASRSTRGKQASLGRLRVGRSLLLPDGPERMSWRVTDAGFRMTLARDVPQSLERVIGEFLDDVADRTRTFAVHPGGPEIIDAVDVALGLEGRRGMDASREVLRRYGNMSSATVLFVLDEALRRGGEVPATLVAFGPGLSVERVDVDVVDPGQKGTAADR